MAKAQTVPATEPKAPDFIAFHVASKGDKSFWNRIGASWLHNDGNGMTLQLDTVPVNGRIVMRAPFPERETGRA